MDLPQIENYQELFLDEIPMLDVRAPVEYEQGAFPNTSNIPLMNDDERQKVGLCYKQKGQQAAIELGHGLVSGNVKRTRVDAWSEFIKQHPQGVLYCFRGGLRSRITQQWIYENTGVIYPRVKGGYKAMRRFLIDQLDETSKHITPIILSGRTGIGKTLLLDKIKHKIDLEAIYYHRGSVFGKHATPQPSQIDIENKLSIELLKLRNNNIKHIVFEDEAISIGSRRIPDVLFNLMKQSPLVILEASVDERVEITFNEYIEESLSEYQALLGEEKGFETWAENLQNSLSRIQKRLGGVRFQEYKTLMAEAIKQQCDTGDKQAHKIWIRNLLTEYYDPMYDYQLSRKKDRKILSGNQSEVLAFLADEYHIG
ncbi:MAG TPA: tRNA 2-selenouridine(34) synthase MnmH [Gammaproteobacteria bacterium]|nr:tRNA 2-selenouridine(34) synthase MnmH [Gammaproteobacteria bacterium]